MIIATLSKTAVRKAKEIAKNLNANAVIVEVDVNGFTRQMVVSEEAYINRVSNQKITRIATVTPTGTIN